MKFLLELAFLGTGYGGWQVQKNVRTVQQTLQDAVEAAFGRRLPVTGCSRTDSGVHANMFCCTVETDSESNRIPTDKIPVVLNSFLPEDISVYGAGTVPDGFHPRYSAVGKEYKYVIWNGRLRDPFMAGRSYFYPKRLDDKKMSVAAEYFKGEHDFASFMSAGSKITDTVRRIYNVSVVREGDTVYFTVSGNGFLYNMVRIMTGTLIGVSEGRFSSDGVAEIIEARNRGAAGVTVPACGLYLNRVFYPEADSGANFVPCGK